MSVAQGAYDESNVVLAAVLSIAAGLCTSIGGLSVFAERFISARENDLLAGGLAVSAGVMLHVSYEEIFRKGVDALESQLGAGPGYAVATACLFGGMLVCAGLEAAVHVLLRLSGSSSNLGHDFAEVTGSKGPLPPASSVHAHSTQASSSGGPSNGNGSLTPTSADAADVGLEPSAVERQQHRELHAMAMLTAAAVALHNFPEGLAVFVATVLDPTVGGALVIGIALHNIPEGMAVAMPVYYSSGSRVRAVAYATLSGLTEPIGGCLGARGARGRRARRIRSAASVRARSAETPCLTLRACPGWLALRTVLSDIGFGIVFGLVAGMMLYIVVLEMMPTAFRYASKCARAALLRSCCAFCFLGSKGLEHHAEQAAGTFSHRCCAAPWRRHRWRQAVARGRTCIARHGRHGHQSCALPVLAHSDDDDDWPQAPGLTPAEPQPESPP